MECNITELDRLYFLFALLTELVRPRASSDLNKRYRMLEFFKSLVPSLVASACLLIAHFSEFSSPVFPGDSGIRLANANSLVVLYGKRVWLPYLQIHIYLLNMLGAPVWCFKLIPMFYEVAFYVFFNLIANRVLKPNLLSNSFVTLVLLSIVWARPMEFVHFNLYQELPALALYHLLILLIVIGRSDSLAFFLILGLGVLVRELFWIYFFVGTALGLCARSLFASSLCARSRVSLRSISYWCIPLIVLVTWLWYSNQGLLPSSETRGVVLTEEVLSARFERLVGLFYLNSIDISFLMLLMGLLIAFSSFRLSVGKVENCRYLLCYTLFSLVSLIIVYGHIIIVDPWEETALNRRMAIPFIMHLPVWLLLLFSQSYKLSFVFRVVLQVCCLVGPVFMFFWREH